MTNKQKIKVLNIVPALNVDSGVASFSMNYLRKIDHDRFTVDFVIFNTHETPYYDEIRKYGGEVYLLPAVSSLEKHLKECKRIITEGKYDIVHNNALTKSLPLMWCAYKRKVPVRILHSHNASLGASGRKVLLNRTVLSMLKRLSTGFFACSDAAGKCYFATRPYNRVPNVINDAIFRFDQKSRDAIRSNMSVTNKTVICSVGRLAAQKNPYFALNVIKALAERNHSIVYWWIGTGSIEPAVKEYAHSLGLDGIVSFLGARNDMRELYQAMDVFFLPSLFEGLPVTGVETQAMGLPAVVSDTVTKEMVYTDLVEYVSLGAPIEKWVEAMEKQIQRIPERRAYTKELESSVFSINNAGHNLECLYEKLLDESHA